MKATLLERSLEKSFRVAGGNPCRQPSTFSLLGGYFTKEDLSSLFCGRLNAAQAEERRKLAMEFLRIIMEVPRGHVRTAMLGVLRESFPAPAVHGEEDNNGMIRFDLKFPLSTPLDCPREIWIDHAIVQETCPTHAENTLNYLEAKETNLPAESPPFRKMHNSKAQRYKALVSVAEHLVESRKLNFRPTFLFPVVSALGFMNKDMSELLTALVTSFADKLKEQSSRADGLPAGLLRSRFKQELRNSVCFALLKGNALAAYNQGTNGVSHPP